MLLSMKICDDYEWWWAREKLEMWCRISNSREMNLLRAAILPVNFCIFFGLLGEGIAWIVFIRSGLVSITRCVTMYPMNFLELTSNENLEGLSFMLYFLNIEIAYRKCPIWSYVSNDLMSISSNPGEVVLKPVSYLHLLYDLMLNYDWLACFLEGWLIVMADRLLDTC